MKRNLLAIVALTVLIAACTKTDVLQKTEANEPGQLAAKPKTPPAPINFTAPMLFPEGVVYNPFNDRFLVSSIAQGTIGAVTPDGVYSPFIQDAALASTAGMEIDKARKRLLVTSSTVQGSLAQLAIYDLNTKNRLFLIDLVALANDGAPHLANDVALDQHGNAYVTDSYAGNIYKVDHNGNATVFYSDPVYTPAPGGFGFNGIEYSSSQGGYLLVGHTALNRVVKIPVNNPGALSIVQFTPSVFSPDGLLLSKNSKELVVVSNTAQFPGSKVISYKTTNNWATATSTDEFETGIVYPTTLTSDGKTQWVLYSYIHLLFGNIYHQNFTIQPLPFSNNNPF